MITLASKHSLHVPSPSVTIGRPNWTMSMVSMKLVKLTNVIISFAIRRPVRAYVVAS